MCSRTQTKKGGVVRDYRIILQPIDVAGPDDFDEAKARFEADLDDQEVGWFGAEYELHVADVQQMPRERGNEQQGIMARLGEPRPAGEPDRQAEKDAKFHERYSGGEPPSIVHPWD